MNDLIKEFIECFPELKGLTALELFACVGGNLGVYVDLMLAYDKGLPASVVLAAAITNEVLHTLDWDQIHADLNQ